MEKVLVGSIILLFWVGSAYAGYYVAAHGFPGWLALLIFSLIALVFLDRRR